MSVGAAISQERGAPATQTEPADAVRSSVISVCGAGQHLALEVALGARGHRGHRTCRSGCCSGAWPASVTYCWVGCAVGAVSVRVRRSVPPPSQPTEPGRLTVA